MVDSVALDPLDRQLAHALQLDGRASFSRIAAVLGVSDRTVARRYQRLRPAGVLRVVGLPQASSLGLVDWFVRIQCTPEAAPTVAAALANRADTSWVGLAAGGTEITALTRAAGGSSRDSLLLPKLPRTSRITAVRAQCILRTVAGTAGWHGRTAALTERQTELLTEPAPPGSGSLGSGSGRPVELTDPDRRLFAELAQDGRAAVPDLASATGCSESAVRRRLQELRAAGVLYFDVDIDPMRYGFAFEAVLWLNVAPAALDAVAEALAAHPEVAYAAATTGPSNLAAMVVCRDADALYEYLARQLGGLQGVLSAEATPVTRHIKRSGALLRPARSV